MQEDSRYAVGIDVGSTEIRCVVGHVDASSGSPTIVGVGKAPCNGMRKGNIVNLNNVFQALDTALGEAERMSGHRIDAATMSVNGTHISSTKADGMIVVGPVDHQINEDDVARLEEVATVGKIPANRDILEVVPYSFRLDGQGDIKDPIGMTGTRLEISANIISAMSPNIANLQNLSEKVNITANQFVPSTVAASRAVLSESQLENGVAVIDFGGSTTGVSVYEEGDLQYVGVIPMGGVNITKDLAIGLKVDPELAEIVKINHSSLKEPSEGDIVEFEHEGNSYKFNSEEIYNITEARVDEIFEKVQEELLKSGLNGRLPSGVVFVGGSSNIDGLLSYARNRLNLAAKLGMPRGFAGVADEIKHPEYSAVVGLMLTDSFSEPRHHDNVSKSKKILGSNKSAGEKASGALNRIFNMFKS